MKSKLANVCRTKEMQIPHRKLQGQVEKWTMEDKEWLALLLLLLYKRKLKNFLTDFS